VLLGHVPAVSAGVASRSSKRGVLLRPLLAVLCFCLVACVHSSRTQGEADGVCSCLNLAEAMHNTHH
jgi:hypothetical protein